MTRSEAVAIAATMTVERLREDAKMMRENVEFHRVAGNIGYAARAERAAIAFDALANGSEFLLADYSNEIRGLMDDGGGQQAFIADPGFDVHPTLTACLTACQEKDDDHG
jgi:hypothetical protein